MNANNQKNTKKISINIDLNPPKKSKISYEKQLPLEDFIQENHKKLKQYICPLCTGVLVEAVMDSKGHMFCKKCLLNYEKKHFSKNKKLQCPISNHILKLSDLKSYELINNYLREMICVCPNKKKGCKWEGKYYLRKDHIDKECEFINEEICPNEGCNLKLKTENINDHLLICDYRKINCEKCDKEIIFNNKKGHIKECIKENILCQKCGITILRENLEKHLKDDCPEMEIDCDFLFFGCKDKFLRKNKRQHYIGVNQIINHDKMTLNWFHNLKIKLNNSLTKIQNNSKENKFKLNYLKQNFINSV